MRPSLTTTASIKKSIASSQTSVTTVPQDITTQSVSNTLSQEKTRSDEQTNSLLLTGKHLLASRTASTIEYSERSPTKVASSPYTISTFGKTTTYRIAADAISSTDTATTIIPDTGSRSTDNLATSLQVATGETTSSVNYVTYGVCSSTCREIPTPNLYYDQWFDEAEHQFDRLSEKVLYRTKWPRKLAISKHMHTASSRTNVKSTS